MDGFEHINRLEVHSRETLSASSLDRQLLDQGLTEPRIDGRHQEHFSDSGVRYSSDLTRFNIECAD